MKVIHKAGKRKTAIARATMKAGKGVVRINYTTLENYEPEIAKLKITEPLLIAGKMSEKYNFQINVRGGGWQSQAEAARLAIARCLMEADGKLKDKCEVTFYVISSSSYQLELQLTSAPDYGQFCVTLDGEPFVPLVDLYADRVELSKSIQFKKRFLSEGLHKLQFELV